MKNKFSHLFQAAVILFTFPIHNSLAQNITSYQPAYREFKDWVVGCNNTGSCTVQSANEQNKFELSIEREAGAKGRLQITLLAGEEKQQYTTLSADSKPIRADKKYWSKNDFEWQSNDVMYILALINVIKNNSRLQWSENYNREASISLQGLTASLLFVDEQQKRLNTPTAFIKRGNKPEANIPPAAPATKVIQPTDKLSLLTQKQTQQLIQSVRKTHAKLLKDEDCIPENESFDSASKLNQQEALVSIGCWQGAYNTSSFIFRTPINAPEKAKQLILYFPGTVDKATNKKNSVTIFTNTDYDVKTRIVSMYAKSRGIGDCGESASWQFDGKQFNLISWNYMGICAGSVNWLPLWISK